MPEAISTLALKADCFTRIVLVRTRPVSFGNDTSPLSNYMAYNLCMYTAPQGEVKDGP
jgi:hypothetical protein